MGQSKSGLFSDEKENKVIGKNHKRQYILKKLIGEGICGKVYYSPPYAIKEINC